MAIMRHMGLTSTSVRRPAADSAVQTASKVSSMRTGKVTGGGILWNGEVGGAVEIASV